MLSQPTALPISCPKNSRHNLLKFDKIPLLALYNGQRGKRPKWNSLMKWVFYLYYPLHLLLLGLLRLL
ncbi:MAG: hypothetical protein J6Q54_07210 [Oscillospiraceae bacterium]|nr:hypothetical protein [Oscillospiraceae bacterium]